jgi:hypothetical protein
MIDIREHGGAFGAGKYRKGSKINVLDLVDAAPYDKFLGSSGTSTIEFAHANGYGQFLFKYNGYVDFYAKNGRLSTTYAPDCTWMIPLKHLVGKYVSLENGIFYLQNQPSTRDTTKAGLSWGGNGILLLSYEVGNKLVLVFNTFWVTVINLDTWSMVYSGQMTNTNDQTVDIYSWGHSHLDYANGIVYAKTGEYEGALISFPMTDTPVYTSRVPSFYGSKLTVNYDGTKVFVQRADTNLIDVYNTATWVKERSFTISGISSHGDIVRMLHLDDKDAMLVHITNSRIYVISTADGSILSTYNKRWTTNYKMERVAQRDKSGDCFYFDSAGPSTAAELHRLSTIYTLK